MAAMLLLLLVEMKEFSGVSLQVQVEKQVMRKLQLHHIYYVIAIVIFLRR